MGFNNTSFVDCKYDEILDLTNVTDAMDILYVPTERMFFNVVLPVVLFVGVTANAAFIFTVSRVKSMQTVTNTYLTQVSISDCIFLIIASVIYVSHFMMSPVRNDGWYHSFVGCMLTFHFILMTYFTSLFLITFVTIERYYAICRPLQHRMVTGKSRTVKIITTSWIMGFLFGACTAPRYSGFLGYCVKWPEDEQFQAMPKTVEFCVSAHPGVYLLSEITQTTPMFMALLANLYMYGAIILALSKRPGTAKTDDNSRPQLQAQRVRNQVARLLIINGTLFFLCQTPVRVASIHNMMVHESGSGLFTDSQYGSILVIGRCLVFVNACVNPCVYVTTSSIYRSAFFEAFGCTNATQRTTTKSEITKSVYLKE